MDFDEDGPPQLVDAAGDVADEEATVKVPITIVTGGYFSICFPQTLDATTDSCFALLKDI